MEEGEEESSSATEEEGESTPFTVKKSSLREQHRLLSVVAAGHSVSGGPRIRKLDPQVGVPATILKVLDENEHDTYSRLARRYQGDPVHEFIPTFRGVVTDKDETGNDCKYICIDNLVHCFHKPKVMDVKLGTRTYLENESQNPKLRQDLFQRMMELYPGELTDVEIAIQAITKHRFMQARDANSTICTLGYRVDGIAGYRARTRKEVADELSRFRTLQDTCTAFRSFVEAAATNEGEAQEPCSQLSVARGILEQLRRFSAALDKSTFVKQHEIIGSSILIIADESGKVGVFWIDFAKTVQLAEGVFLSHREAWHMGNHEDGVQFGLDNLIGAWEGLVQALEGEQSCGACCLAPARCCLLMCELVVARRGGRRESRVAARE